MKMSLLQGLDEVQAKEMRADFISAHLIRKRLSEVLYGKIESQRTSVSNDMENPNWSNKVAYAFGYEAALKEVINILSEKDSK